VSARWPEPAASTLEVLEAQVRDLLGPNLRAMYVCGSLAFGCYNPARSDVDVLVITRRRLAPETRHVLSALLRTLASATPLEISFLSRADLEPWQYPTPFDYHFSRESEVRDRTSDYFATEIANARARGVTLVGPPPEEVLPAVPADDFLDSVERDLIWARGNLEDRPGYAVLNGCRVLAFRSERRVMSKAEAAEWGRSFVPPRFCSLVAEAGNSYASRRDGDLDRRSAAAFVDWIMASR